MTILRGAFQSPRKQSKTGRSISRESDLAFLKPIRPWQMLANHSCAQPADRPIICNLHVCDACCRDFLAHHVESCCRLSSKLWSSAMQPRRAARCKCAHIPNRPQPFPASKQGRQRPLSFHRPLPSGACTAKHMRPLSFISETSLPAPKNVLYFLTGGGVKGAIRHLQLHLRTGHKRHSPFSKTKRRIIEPQPARKHSKITHRTGTPVFYEADAVPLIDAIASGRRINITSVCIHLTIYLCG